MKSEVSEGFLIRGEVNQERELSDDVIATMESLSMVLRPIYLRMKQEGWIIRGGIMHKNHDCSNQ